MADSYGSIHKQLKAKVDTFINSKPADWWSPEEKALVKKLGDIEFLMSREYDYQDDWEDGFENFEE